MVLDFADIVDFATPVRRPSSSAVMRGGVDGANRTLFAPRHPAILHRLSGASALSSGPAESAPPRRDVLPGGSAMGHNRAFAPLLWEPSGPPERRLEWCQGLRDFRPALRLLPEDGACAAARAARTSGPWPLSC